MIIRNEQFRACADLLDVGFASRLMDFLIASYPDSREVAPAELRGAVDRQIARAKFYDFQLEQDISVYVTTAYLLGEDFDIFFPVVHNLLGTDMPANRKSEWLQDWTRELIQTLEGTKSVQDVR